MLLLKFIDSEEVYNVGFSKSGNIVTITGNVPAKETGFRIARRANFNDNWNYTNFKTVYRVLENGVQFSNDGSKYVEPVITKNITISASWDDGDNFNGIRPESLEVNALEQTIVLNEENNWSVTITVDDTEEVVVEAPEVEEYEVEVDGTTIKLSTDYVLPTVPTVEDRLGDLEMAVCELAGLILGEEAQEIEIEEEPEEVEPEVVEEVEE